jgi:hypothetical protein
MAGGIAGVVVNLPIRGPANVRTRWLKNSEKERLFFVIGRWQFLDEAAEILVKQ